MDKKSVKKEEKPKAFQNERDIALDFATRVHEQFDRLVKASVLFGSQAKNTATPSSDIDIILIIDDSSVSWDLELIAWYREELGKLIASLDYGRELHVNTVKLTTWWQDLLYGDPVVINILRYGEVLLDTGGFFNPLKALLYQGKIRSTHEAIYAALQRAPTHLLRSKAAKIGAVEGIYWTFIDSAQAALITIGKIPPSPEHIPQMLHEEFVQRNMLKESYARAMKDIYDLHKGITHGRIHEVKGQDIDRWQQLADAFLGEMTRIIDKVIEANKKK
ncbi:nucleotidyltransferase domain-containing protein [Candidatus Pacearchaeota archaeon]|nr:nucleotidyltransferase domain-containing protein [Candidatus Pacearchaeota archaeon]